MPTPPPLHPEIAHLAFMLGTWSGEGHGEYLTIDPFDYVEEATYGHVGKPFLAYVQKSRSKETGLPLHAEAGYIRPVGLDAVEFVISQPSGLVEIHEGTVIGTSLSFTSTLVSGTATAKSVTAVVREIQVEGDALSYQVAMAAVGLPLQHHLQATLIRQ